jgi:translation initiation factor 5
VIAAIEWLCSTKYPSLLPYFPVLLKHLYDEDILDEDTILAWHADFSRNEFTSDSTLVSDVSLEQLKISAQPFCVWLNEAKEEGESSDDDDEDGDDDAGAAGVSSSASGDDDSEDIDIDAI